MRPVFPRKWDFPSQLVQLLFHLRQESDLSLDYLNSINWNFAYIKTF